VFREACRLGFEGLVSKRRDAPYRPGRNADWLKSKCTRRQEFVVGGFTDSQRGQDRIGAFLVAEVAFTEWTRDGRIRHPSFQGLRADKGPRGVVREKPRIEVAGIAISHPERVVLPDQGIESWVKTTGGLGLHVVVPIVPERDWSECLAFARGVAQAVEREDPVLYTTRHAKPGREAKILIDYLRNNRTNTSIAAFSTRARPGAAVSFPVGWNELTPRLDPLRLTVRTVPRCLARQRVDPWAGYFRSRQRLTVAALRAASASIRGVR